MIALTAVQKTDESSYLSKIISLLSMVVEYAKWNSQKEAYLEVFQRVKDHPQNEPRFIPKRWVNSNQYLLNHGFFYLLAYFILLTQCFFLNPAFFCKRAYRTITDDKVVENLNIY